MNPKIFIATPAYSGTVHVQYAVALAETHTMLLQNGIGCQFQINCSGSLLVMERNRLIHSFLKSDCTHMLCIDGDLGWPPSAVIGLLNHNEDFVAGVYPTRKDNLFLFRPSARENGSLICHETKKLISMECIPAGFMLITRNAINKIIETHPETYFESKDPHSPIPNGYALFNTPVIDQEFWGEDYAFCIKAKKAGLNIWVDPEIEFDHAGVRGMLTFVLTNKKPEEVKKTEQIFVK